MTITDAQVRQLAEGITVTDEGTGRNRTLPGVGVAAWLERTLALRIKEALGTRARMNARWPARSTLEAAA